MSKNFPEEPIQATREVLKSIDKLSAMLHSPSVSNATEVQSQLNNYISQLQRLYAAGNSTSYPVLTDILKFLEEGEISNPWLYMHKEFEDCENAAADLSERKCFLEDLGNDIQKEIQSGEK